MATDRVYARNTECAELKLPVIALALGDGSLNAEIPPIYYSRKTGDDCLMLFEVNDEDNDLADPIRTDVDGYDYETNTGYILGQPFLRAFMLLLDFEGNKIGLATKKKNFGAVLTGPAAPGSDHYKPTPPIKPNDNPKNTTDRPVAPPTPEKPGINHRPEMRPDEQDN